MGQATQDYGFPGGICPTVGVGGLVSGGGIGYMSRKYGLAIDNVVDALIVNVNGTILNRNLMGEDLFWAIRGGGAASFGIIVAWKVELVPVPRTVTVFNVSRNHDQGGVDLVYKSQLASYGNMNESLRMRLEISTINGETQVTFSSIYLGSASELLTAMNESFPELGMTIQDCEEMSLIDAVMYFYFPKGEPKESLRDRKQLPKKHFKGKSDFVLESQPLNKTVIEEIWKKCSETENIHFINHAYGGRISNVSSNQTAFPFREGILYDIEYSMEWEEDDEQTAQKNVEWVRNLYEFMTPYVTKNPRGAYSNFRDFDLGVNNDYETTYENARKWGEMYFQNNFRRLAQVKARVDPENYFALEQTVPPLNPIG